MLLLEGLLKSLLMLLVEWLVEGALLWLLLEVLLNAWGLLLLKVLLVRERLPLERLLLEGRRLLEVVEGVLRLSRVGPAAPLQVVDVHVGVGQVVDGVQVALVLEEELLLRRWRDPLERGVRQARLLDLEAAEEVLRLLGRGELYALGGLDGLDVKPGEGVRQGHATEVEATLIAALVAAPLLLLLLLKLPLPLGLLLLSLMALEGFLPLRILEETLSGLVLEERLPRLLLEELVLLRRPRLILVPLGQTLLLLLAQPLLFLHLQEVRLLQGRYLQVVLLLECLGLSEVLLLSKVLLLPEVVLLSEGLLLLSEVLLLLLLQLQTVLLDGELVQLLEPVLATLEGRRRQLVLSLLLMLLLLLLLQKRLGRLVGEGASLIEVEQGNGGQDLDGRLVLVGRGRVRSLALPKAVPERARQGAAQ